VATLIAAASSHDAVAVAHLVVSKIRSSEQCREAFEDHIKTGIQMRWFRIHRDSNIQIPVLQLLRDVCSW
jgi:hypothetical protein